MTIGKNIAQYRKTLGMTQEDLAQKLGVTNQAVSKWELEQACPDVMLLPALADIFDIAIDALFGRESNRQGTVCADLDWPDDEVLRVVVYEGKRLICGGAAAKDFKLEYRKDVKEILSAVSVTCGDVKGDVYSNLCVNCTEVSGSVDAGTAVNCANVGGSVDAGTNVNCGNVGGGVDAGTNVICGNVDGDVDAGTSVRCGSVSGDIDAGGKVQIG